MQVTITKEKKKYVGGSSSVKVLRKSKTTLPALPNLQGDNELLWEALRTGCKKAIAQLYQNNYQILYSYAKKICRDKDLSKDCVQELFLGLWEKRHNLNKVMSVRSYLLQSIWYLVIKKLKKQNKNVALNENDKYNLDVVFSGECKMIEQQSKVEKKDKLKRALGNLSNRQRQIIFMLYYEGLTIDEIQQITNLKYQSIKNLTHRAMLSLRGTFQVSRS